MPLALTSAAIRQHSCATWIGARIECLDTIDSTNSRVRALGLEGAADGTVVTAEEQTAGRGRLGRSWVSPRGRNLYLSVLLRSRLDVSLLSQLSLTAGLAACEAVGEWCAATLKWPNDVLIGGRKGVGILAELEAGEADRFVVLGIGVNVNMSRAELPPELADKATSLAIECGREIDRAQVAGRLLTHLERRYDQLHRVGFADIAAAWNRLSAMVGRQIRVDEPGGIVAGEVLGLAPDGALCLKREDGREHRVIAGDVTVVGGYERVESGQ